MGFDTVELRVRGPLIRVRRESYAGLTRAVLEFDPVQPGNSRAVHRMLNHPRQSPTVDPCCSYCPVFSSPTVTLEVVGNTGNMSSEKAGVGGSTPSLATTFSLSSAQTLEVLFHSVPKFKSRLAGVCLEFSAIS
jgi:hypothetical protein